MCRHASQIEKYTQILNSAEFFVRESGLFSLSAPLVAKRANCSVNTVYKHFPNKEDLPLSLANRATIKNVVLPRFLALSQLSTSTNILPAQLLYRIYLKSAISGHLVLPSAELMTSPWLCTSRLYSRTSRALSSISKKLLLEGMELDAQYLSDKSSTLDSKELINTLSDLENGLYSRYHQHHSWDTSSSALIPMAANAFSALLKPHSFPGFDGPNWLPRLCALHKQVERFNADLLLWQFNHNDPPNPLNNLQKEWNLSRQTCA